MNKIKNYAIIVLTVFVLLLAWQYNSMRGKRDKERATAERWQGNFMEQLRQNRTIVLTHKEWMKLKSDSITRLMDSLKIKPKTVTKYVEKIIIQKEIDTVLVEVVKIASGTYKLYDSGPCFVWSGIATILTDDSLNVKRTGFSYQNNIVDVYHRKEKGRFLFWKTYYKNKIDMTSVPKCGTASTKTVEILK